MAQKTREPKIPKNPMATVLSAACACTHSVSVTCQAGSEQAVRDDLAQRLCPSCEEGLTAYQAHMAKQGKLPPTPNKTGIWLPGDPM